MTEQSTWHGPLAFIMHVYTGTCDSLKHTDEHTHIHTKSVKSHLCFINEGYWLGDGDGPVGKLIATQA